MRRGRPTRLLYVAGALLLCPGCSRWGYMPDTGPADGGADSGKDLVAKKDAARDGERPPDTVPIG